MIGVGWSSAGRARVGISCSCYPATLALVRGVNAAGFQQETPSGLEILQENRMWIHAAPCCCWEFQENDGWARAGAQDWEEGFPWASNPY